MNELELSVQEIVPERKLEDAFYKVKKDKDGDILLQLRINPIYQLIADYLVNECNLVIRKGTLKPYILDKERNVYYPITIHEIRIIISLDMGELNLISEDDVIKTLKKINAFKTPAYNMVLFKNGVLNMNNLDFYYELDKPLLCLVEIPYNLRKGVNPEHRYCQRFLESSFQQATDKETQEYIIGVMEIIGYLLCSGNPRNKLPIGVGKKGGGKGVFGKILNTIFGEKVSHITLQSMTHNRFATSSFVDSIINIINDSPTNSIDDVGQIKTITGDDDITIEAKGEPIRVLPSLEVPKTIMFCNELPRFVKDSALMSRFLIFEFKHGFRDTSKQILNLADLICDDDDEIEWFIELAVTAYARVLQNGRFSLQLNEKETEALSMKHSDPLAWCICQLIDGYEEPSINNGIISYNDASQIVASEFRQIVIHFAEQEGVNLPLSNGDISGKRFTPAVRRALNIEDDTYGTRLSSIDGEKVRVYEGLYATGRFDDLWRELFFKDR